MLISRLPIKFGRKGCALGIVTDQHSQSENLKLLPFHEIYPFLDMLNKTQGLNARLLRPEAAEKVLERDWSRMLSDFPFATDGIIAFEKAGAKLGREIVYSCGGIPRYVLPTGKYEGEKAALVAVGLSSADFRQDSKDIILDISDARLLPFYDFPEKTGIYERKKQEWERDSEFRGWGSQTKLYRAPGAYVGCLAKTSDPAGKYLRAIYSPWDNYSIIVIWDRDVSKLISRGVPQEEIESLLESAKKELWDVATTIKRSKIPSLIRLVSSLEEKK